MRKRIYLIVALGTLFAAVAAGTASSVGSDSDKLVVYTPMEMPPECSDTFDNDEDGLIDGDADKVLEEGEDPDCQGPKDDSEAPEEENGDEQPSEPTPPAKTKPLKPGGKVEGLFGKEGPTSKHGGKGAGKAWHKVVEGPSRTPGGAPTAQDPSLTIADYGAAPIGVPNFVIDQFEIPPFLLPIYQACGTQYGIPWQVLASINKIETAFGTNLNVSSAGARGWMQFMPPTWDAYGVDANRDGKKDPYNPVDAICAAARYLKAAGGSENLREAIFAYNHADWYVDEVLMYANQYGKLPEDLVGSLTGLTEGAHFPIAADSRYADDISEREALRRSRTNRIRPGNAADVVGDSPTRRGIDIFSSTGAAVVAVNDGVVRKIGRDRELGTYLVLEDAYGNRYTYAQLGSLADRYAAPKRSGAKGAGGEPESQRIRTSSADSAPGDEAPPVPSARELGDRFMGTASSKAALPRKGLDAQLGKAIPGYASFRAYAEEAVKFDPRTMVLRPLREGAHVTGGTVLGRVGSRGAADPHIHFEIRPAGRGAPRIDPKPILDGWKLLEATAIYRAAGESPFGRGATIGQILMMPKTLLIKRVLANPKLEIYECGRSNVRAGQINRRVLAALEYLTQRGYRLTVTSLLCGHSYLTSSGNVSAHSSGNAVDIASVNGIPVLGNQGRGSLTEAVVKDLMRLQGTMAPAQIITLMEMGGPTFAMSDHDDHIHLGFTPPFAPGDRPEQAAQVLKPGQWQRLMERIGKIDNPDVGSDQKRTRKPEQAARRGRGD